MHALPILLPFFALSLSLSLRPASASACLIQGQAASIDDLEVRPIDEESFKLSVRQVQVQVTPGRDGQSDISVLAPLRFRTTHATDALDIRFGQRSSLADGRVVIANGAIPTIVADGKTTTTDSVSARLGMLEFVPEAPIAVPCSALTVSSGSYVARGPGLELTESKIGYLHTDARLPLYAQARARDPLWMQFKGVLQVVGKKRGWLHVKASWSDGSRVEGWIPEGLAKVHKAVPEQTTTAQMGMLSMGSCGRSHPPRLAAFTLRAGAPIHTRAKGVIWAHSASVISVKAFPLDRSDGWMQIAAVAGLPAQPCSEHVNIWVHASDLVWTAKPL